MDVIGNTFDPNRMNLNTSHYNLLHNGEQCDFAHIEIDGKNEHKLMI